MPYLYGPTLLGLPYVAERAYLQPCLHDESYAYLPRVAEVAHLAKGLLFNSAGEYELALRLFGPGIAPKSTIVGEGVEFLEDVPAPAERIGAFVPAEGSVRALPRASGSRQERSRHRRRVRGIQTAAARVEDSPGARGRAFRGVRRSEQGHRRSRRRRRSGEGRAARALPRARAAERQRKLFARHLRGVDVRAPRRRAPRVSSDGERRQSVGRRVSRGLDRIVARRAAPPRIRTARRARSPRRARTRVRARSRRVAARRRALRTRLRARSSAERPEAPLDCVRQVLAHGVPPGVEPYAEALGSALRREGVTVIEARGDAPLVRAGGDPTLLHATVASRVLAEPGAVVYHATALDAPLETDTPPAPADARSHPRSPHGARSRGWVRRRNLAAVRRPARVGRLAGSHARIGAARREA